MNAQNVNYFIPYLRHFYNTIISEKEMETILKKIRCIKISVKRDYDYYSFQYARKIIDIIQNSDYFYSKNTKDFSVHLYKIKNENNLPMIVKIYKYYPKYIFSKYMLEHRFENEIVFQKYAHSLNKTLDFISPEIYSFGKVSFPSNNVQTEYLFIMMEYIEGIVLTHDDFRPEFCKKIYEIDIGLKKQLLNHNDITPKNILISEKDEIVLLDYGESNFCG
jgi:serine/threonine protein kinase